MIKKLLVSFCLLLALASYAQEGSYSPYSFYGIGDQRFKGTIENRAMGGLSIFPDSIHINIQNPAGYASLKMTTFSVAGTYTWANLKTESQEEKAKRMTLDYLTAAFPFKKGAIAFGLMPYTSVGYKIRGLEVTNGGDSIVNSYNGSGGINRVFLGAGYQIAKGFNFGLDVNYNFGKSQTTKIAQATGVQFASREINTSDFSGFSANFGLMYERKVTKKLHMFSGLTFTPGTNIHTKDYRNIATVQLTQIGGAVIVDQDTIFHNRRGTLKLPSRLSFGVGIGEPRKWQAGAEVAYTAAKDLTNRDSEFGRATFENAIKYSIGGYYIPNYNSYTSYFDRIVFRAGARYENTGLVVDGHTIWDAAGTAGIGLPVTGLFSNFNITFEYGKRGTQAYGLVAENYANLGIGLSFNDRWFVRRRYD